jgi:hypothetical protein
MEYRDCRYKAKQAGSRSQAAPKGCPSAVTKPEYTYELLPWDIHRIFFSPTF